MINRHKLFDINSRSAGKIKSEGRNMKRKKEIRELEEMLGLRRRRIIPEIKVWTPKEEKLQRKIRKIKEINRRRLKIAETASALRGFTRQFRIEGIPRHAPREFMQIARKDILKLMRENRQTRVRLILNCEMTRKELFSESTQILNTRIGDLKEFFRLMFISQISNRFVDPLSSRFPVKSQPRKRL